MPTWTRGAALEPELATARAQVHEAVAALDVAVGALADADATAV